MKSEDTIESTMRSMIMGWGRGRIFFIDDFAALNDNVSVRQFLSCMAKDGFIIRLARGIYCYPQIAGGEFSSKRLLPGPETIAYALAAKENVRIIPYGDYAANKLGLSGLVVSNLKYLTDGSPRIINLSATSKIYFNHTSEVKMFAFRNETLQMLCSAIRALGEDHFKREEIKRKVLLLLKDIPEKDFHHDIALPPAWVAKVLSDLWYI